MSRSYATLALLLTAAYAIAAVVPCEPASLDETAGRVTRVASTSGASGHDHGPDGHGAHGAEAAAGSHESHGESAGAHAHASSEAAADDAPTGHCHEPPSLIPRCPCGCDEKSRARTPGGRLDPTVLAATDEPTVLPAACTPDTAPTRWRRVDGDPPDKVPLLIS